MEADDEQSELSVRFSARRPAAARRHHPRHHELDADTAHGDDDESLLYQPMTPIADADSTAAVSREVTSFAQWPVLPAIRIEPEIEHHTEGIIIIIIMPC